MNTSATSQQNLLCFPAPSFRLEQTLSELYGPPRVLPSTDTFAFQPAPPALSSLLTDEVQELFHQYWDRVPFRFTLREEISFDFLQSLQSFTKLVDTTPGHLQEIVRNKNEIQFKPTTSAFEPTRSFRVEYLKLMTDPEAWKKLQVFEHWLGGVSKDYWFYTPPNTESVPVHADAQNNLVFQLYGTKHWRLYPPVYPKPIYGVGRYPIESEQLDTTKEMEITLNPGDVLYLPRGVPHIANTADNEGSIHLDLNLLVPARLNLLTQRLMRSVFEEWHKGGLEQLTPIGVQRDDDQQSHGVESIPTELACMDSIEGRRCWWSWGLEADFERTHIDGPGIHPLARLADREVRLFKRNFTILQQESFFMTQGKGFILCFPESFYDSFVALSRGVQPELAATMEKARPLEFRWLREHDWLL